MGDKTVKTAAMLFVLFLFSEAWAFDNSQLIEDAEGGDREAQYTLAHLLLKGRGGVSRDDEAALGWLDRAARAGHGDAAFELALMYLTGERVEKDSQKALLWLGKAAEAEQTEAQYYLGLAYAETDWDRARAWFEKAAASGHQKAAQELQQQCRKLGSSCD